jgi:hypothetical protein
VKQKSNLQLAIDRLMEQCRQSRSAPSCKLGHELLSHRGGACSACTSQREFDLDRAVAHLINTATFKRVGMCPYQIIASHLVAGLLFGPEAFRARGVGRKRIDPVVEVKQALKHVRTVLQACGLSRENIDVLSYKGNRWHAALYAVQSAEHALGGALELFQPQISEKTRRSPHGRTGALHNQALARAMAGAWRVLTGRLPAKDNVRFHGLLHAASATIFGHRFKEPNWEAATKRAAEHIRKDIARRT